MAAKNTALMLSALSSDLAIKIFEILSEGDETSKRLAEKIGIAENEIIAAAKKMENAEIIIAYEEDDCFVYSLDPKQVAIITGFFELILNKCSPPKCCR